jgi:hypothetical protein
LPKSDKYDNKLDLKGIFEDPIKGYVTPVQPEPKIKNPEKKIKLN